MPKPRGRRVAWVQVLAARAAPWTFAALLTAASAQAQTGAPSPVLSASSGTGQVLVMPLAAEAPSSVVIRGVRIDMAVEEGYCVYRAKHRGRTHTARTALNGPPRHLAFDLEQGRFSEVAQTLRLRLADPASLEGIIADTEAIGGKAYPALGWALLRLPRHANPAAVARALQGHQGVISAEVQLRSAIRVPM